jgi:hypothetical protein
MSEAQTYTLSDQALGALMLALQKSLMEQTDIVPLLKGFQLVNTPAGLDIMNPPVVHVPNKEEE